MDGLSRRILLLVLPFVAACGASDAVIDNTHALCRPLVLQAGPDATAEERAALAEALEMWRRAGRHEVTLEPVAGIPVVEVRFEDAAPLFKGVYDDELGVVYVNRRLTDAHARAVTVAHELGHVFGLDHIDEGERVSVMNRANDVVEPSREDWLAAVALSPACAAP